MNHTSHTESSFVRNYAHTAGADDGGRGAHLHGCSVFVMIHTVHTELCILSYGMFCVRTAGADPRERGARRARSWLFGVHHDFSESHFQRLFCVHHDFTQLTRSFAFDACALQVLTLESAVPIFTVALQASLPLQLLDVPANVAILSRSPPDEANGNHTLATYRCVCLCVCACVCVCDCVCDCVRTLEYLCATA